MMFLEVDLAIYQRLTGAPLDSQGRPQMDPVTRVPTNSSRILPVQFGGGYGPSWGVRIPSMKHPHDLAHGLTSHDPLSIPLFKGLSGGLKQIPVFAEDVEARKFLDTWPCVTFKHVSHEFDPSVFYYPDVIRDTNPLATTEYITNRLGDTVQSGQSSFYDRPHPESYKVRYELTARAKNNIEAEFLSDAILRLFPARGAIRVYYADGTEHVCDMLQVDSRVNDVIGAGAGAEEQRNYIRTFAYDVEAYVDNTIGAIPGLNDENTMLQDSLIQTRILELYTLQERLFGVEELNSQELEAI